MTLESLQIVHADGTVARFVGQKLQDESPKINQFLLKLGEDSVIIHFDCRRHQRIWRCSCGGRNYPYMSCSHLRYLEILPNTPDTITVSSEELEEPVVESVVIEQTLIHTPITRKKRIFADKDEEI